MQRQREYPGVQSKTQAQFTPGHEKLGPMGDRCDARTVIDLLLETASILVMG